ncbi:MAG: HAD family phosphatase [Anaerolineae bacterium]|nr:HAD family phosphatase [Anaerolineae bacterium]
MSKPAYTAPLRWAVFDLDGTLKQARDPYVFLHERLGVAEEAAPITEAGLSGRIPYEEWLRLDVGFWRGQPVARLQAWLWEIPYLPGAREAVGELRRRGLHLAILTTGPQFHAEMVARELGMEQARGNEVGVQEGIVTGEIGRVIPLGGKGPALRQLLEAWGADPAACLAVGDGESDVPMFRQVGVAVAVCPESQAVREAADLALETPDLTGLVDALLALDPSLLPPAR